MYSQARNDQFRDWVQVHQVSNEPLWSVRCNEILHSAEPWKTLAVTWNQFYDGYLRVPGIFAMRRKSTGQSKRTITGMMDPY